MLEGFIQCKHTHTQKHTHKFTRMNAVNLRCIQQKQRLMTRKTGIDFLPVTCNKSVTHLLTENNQRGQIYQLKEVCECVEGTECQGPRCSLRSPLTPRPCHPFSFPPLSKQRMFVSHWLHCNRNASIFSRISSCLGRMDVRYKTRF